MKINYIIPSFGKVATSPDYEYKKSIQKGLKDTFEFNAKIEDFDSVAGPVELRKLLKKFQPKDFNVGIYEKDTFNNPNLFKNVKNGSYRVNLHTHSRKSDGSMTPGDFLEMAVKYADKAALKNPDSDIPSFTIALTDHNTFEGAKEIVSLIAQNPEKYKNLKFVTGCEFNLYDENSPFKYKGFEAVGLGFNPFDKELNKKIQTQNPTRIIEDIKKADGLLSYAHPYILGQQAQKDFIKYLKEIGIEGIESNYQYLGHKYTDELIEVIEEAKMRATEFDLFETGGTDSHGRNIFSAKAEKELDELLN